MAANGGGWLIEGRQQRMVDSVRFAASPPDVAAQRFTLRNGILVIRQHPKLSVAPPMRPRVPQDKKSRGCALPFASCELEADAWDKQSRPDEPSTSAI